MEIIIRDPIIIMFPKDVYAVEPLIMKNIFQGTIIIEDIYEDGLK